MTTPSGTGTTTTAAIPSIPWAELQGGILRGYGHHHARHVLVGGDVRPAALRAFLHGLVPHVTDGRRWAAPPASTTNVALTAAGLDVLAPTAQQPAPFAEGMAARSARLGDTGPDAPATWADDGVHVPGGMALVLVRATSEALAERCAAGISQRAAAHGLDVLAVERGARLRGPTGRHDGEHFGFVDGISQPAVAGARGPTTVPGNGTPQRDGGWAPVQPGEFVLGLPDEEEASPPLPRPAWLWRHGSFLVHRRLTQDVAAFRRLCQQHAGSVPGGADEVAAKLVGRRPDGTSIAVGAPDERRLRNVFTYDHDVDGRGCPIGSHVRRANPRYGRVEHPLLGSRHRLLRRGVPYGPPLAPGALDDDGVERGLLFLAHCADIARQYEFVQRAWMADGDAFGLGTLPDPLVGGGDAPRRFAVPGADGPVLLFGLPRLVRVRSGAYLFEPSRPALQRLTED